MSVVVYHQEVIRGDFIDPYLPNTISWNDMSEFWRARLLGMIFIMSLAVDTVFTSGLHTVHIFIPFQQRHNRHETRSSLSSTTVDLGTSRTINVGQKQ